MNSKQYQALKDKYTIPNSQIDDVRRMAFEEFDAALEEYDNNEKSEWNDGDELMDISRLDVECILDDYIARIDGIIDEDTDEDTRIRFCAEEMRNAIMDVVGLVC